ncbi:Killer toxin subunits alpha/beta [Colletotrichum sp. SAR 10_99]|nr:Killer toxin subunits alpha/beta [Colletotrichum sp. SAR 10_99]
MCNETMLLDFNPSNSLHKDETVRACTASFAVGASNVTGNNATQGPSCLPKCSVTKVQESLQLGFNVTKTPAELKDFEAASEQLAASLSRRESNSTDITTFAYSNTVALGLFAGSGVRHIPPSVLRQFITKIKTTGFSDSVVAQLCAKDGRSSRYSLGIAVSGDRDLKFVQDAVATWASGECIASFDKVGHWQDITLSIPSISNNSTASFGNSTRANSIAGTASSVSSRSNMLQRRAECSTVQVVSGDSCASLAAECGISASDFTTYNPDSTLCSTLQVGQHVCCSAGDLPDFRPQPNSDGTCFSYYVVPGDSCSSLGAANSLTNDEIESFNTQTWGWQGCSNVQAYQYICLSSGAPPMPAPIANAVCGPQKPGTTQPGAGVDLASLNPCPLNACCNKHGQCGINKDFCTISQSETGAPGTSAEGENGCISNCGTEIVVGSAPAQAISIGYFEAYNLDRPCLNMKITAMDVTPYTHIHLAFGVVTTGTYAIDVSHIQEQWELFQQMSGFKKILSLGGWAFSAEPATYFIFRDAVNPANQDTFVANIVAFVQDNDLDGIDIDWEYPAAPDIPDIPAGTAEDAANYLTFFTKLRAAMPSDKSVSFCAPASFWYLKGYHIEEMAELADYIVYMTYDLHGQWDYSNQYAIDGCPEGNCLRSHTNITETLLALSMITKAGVPSNKLAVGVSSYGRSFQMTTPGCTGPMCTYTGDGSGAYPGPCTGTTGYIANAEINSILAGTGTWMTSSGALQSIESYSSYFDEDSQSNIAVYDSTQWVAHMDDDLKADRKALYESLNFAGIIDWAIDLQGFGGDSIDYGSSSNIVYPPPSIWDSDDPLVGCEPPCIVVFPPYPLSATHTVTSWPALTTTLLSSGAGGVYVVTTTIPVPSFTMTDVSLQPLTLQSTDTAHYSINPVQSITPSSFVYTLPPNHATFPVTTPTPATSSDTDVPLVIIPPVTFYPTSVPVTIQPQPTYSVDYPDPTTSCVTSTACNGQDTATTTTPGSPECSMDPDIAAALSAEQAADQTMIDGKQIPLEFAPTNPSDYDGSTFTAKQFGLTETITVIATSTKTTTPTTTVTVVVEPTAKADCAYWITAFGWYTFEVYNIDGWSTDGGSRLKSEEKGCGALTGWDWRERTSSKYAGAYFNLPFFMKDGCVERAIVSAGGPKLSCEFTGYDIGVAFLPAKKRSTPEKMADDLPELRRRQIIFVILGYFLPSVIDFQQHDIILKLCGTLRFNKPLSRRPLRCQLWRNNLRWLRVWRLLFRVWLLRRYNGALQYRLSVGIWFMY